MFLSPVDSTDLGIEFDAQYPSFDKNFKNTLSTVKTIEYIKIFQQKLLTSKESLAKLITLTMGKMYHESLQEVHRSSKTIDNYLHHFYSLKGTSDNLSKYEETNKQLFTNYYPLGSILCMVPFNFPVNLALHKIIPALLMKNFVFYRPHPQTDAVGNFLIRLLYESGFQSSEIIKFLPSPSDLQKIFQEKSIQAISFTGGAKVASIIQKNCGLKKTLFELGGNDPIVLFPDGDKTLFIKKVLEHRLGCAGQRCTSAKRIFIHQSIYSKVKEELFFLLKQISAENPFSDHPLGPLVSSESASHLYTTFSSFALLSTKPHEAYLNPILVEGNNYLDFFTEEFFGPIFAIFSFDSTEHVLSMISTSPYMLQAGIFTDNLSLLKECFKSLAAGTVLHNEGPSYRLDSIDFGGGSIYSGLSREGGNSTLLEMSYLKNLIL